ncbi:helix-turn-helix transcriptional regulator [Lysinibacillus sphaericus]|uniref:Helix-turn-helix XRE-family like protein n=3 Tax=Lysinibacillus TaxID=400634 RepID=B1HX59_LYSSC|nr:MULTISPECIES: helix-turn-helix transcriptional regulator [Lysinibacillus]MBE5084611.1 helix-turn-helix transcriptional regulator [Bacillus thuringiensis]ACA41635.1 Helix-turn-helix XRE-family like protein [Lysinibacillus sphaericus C3-41]AMO32502.1 transcriptional regulator [Lysinibacillus sphaericus]AMR92397.1 transcriptional regulator [Lysinibacillus sphaericus]ANA46446.1 transcriptional regulator [Lysinibacillus sphaericus]
MFEFELKNNNDTKLQIALKGETLRSFSSCIGVSHAFLSQVLNKRRKPSAIVAGKIAKGLGKEIDEIFLVRLVDSNRKSGAVK